MWNLLEKDGVDAVNAIAEDDRKRKKEEAILWTTIWKFGRLVIASRKKYSHMRKCGDLLIDLDWNQARFVKLSDLQMKAYKEGNLRQNQVVCDKTPEDISELEVEVKTILKKDFEESKKIRVAFIEKQAEIKAKKEWNITVVAPLTPAPVVDDGKAKANADKEAELDAKTKELAEKEAKLNAKLADLEKEPAKAIETPKAK